MNAIVNVREIKGLEVSAQELMQVQCDTMDAAETLQGVINSTIIEAEGELGISNLMLAEARTRETIAFTKLVAAEAELAAASAEFAAASASGNPLFIAEASVRLAEAEANFLEAQSEHNQAVQHRERMELRVELCQRALNQANILFDNTHTKCQHHSAQIDELVQNGVNGLNDAYTTLERYCSMTTSVQRQEYQSWKQPEKTQENKDKPVMPKEVIFRLNPSKTVMLAVLAELTSTEYNFRQTIERLRCEGTQGEIAKATLTIRKNVSGRLAEEIVKRAFAPYGFIQEQTRKELEESYTKVDLLFSDANAIIILSRGLSVPKGGSLGIEVKTGNKNYLQAQKSHLVEIQIPGHASCDASCVLMSRDIHNLSSAAEQGLREAISDSGSRVLAMLPMKEVLDDVCIEFVFGSNLEENKNV